MKIGVVCFGVLGVAACATDAEIDQSARQRVVTEGRSVYVVHVATEQEGRASAVSICRQRGGTAVFSEIVQFKYRRTRTTAAHFDCTI